MIAETCAELGCKISFGSDAHIATRIADAHSVIKLLEEVDFPEELMACRDAQTFLDTIADAMQQNNYLQREITAARTVYNSRVTQWNTDIFSWPTKMIVAAQQGYTTRIPFTTSAEIREAARSKFF